MSGLNVVICDDDLARLEVWQAELGGLSADVIDKIEALTASNLAKVIAELSQRRANARAERQTPAPDSGGAAVIDSADVLILDYDLLDLPGRESVTGESLAYLARCYSSAKVIVVMNQFGENSFDLSMDPHMDSFADLNIGSVQLANPWLWGEQKGGFAPWHWPSLPWLVETFDARTSAVTQASSLESALGLREDWTQDLPRLWREFLEEGETDGKDWKERFQSSPLGLRAKDKPMDDEGTNRVIAARLWAWLYRLVLPAQDHLVDAPHLASRFPRLLQHDPDQIAVLDQTARREREDNLFHASVEDHVLKLGPWIQQPVWDWRALELDDAVRDVLDEDDREVVDARFCEDLSRYLPAELTRTFVPEVESIYLRRHVLANTDEDEIAQSIKGMLGVAGYESVAAVAYRPEVRFAL